MARAALDEFQSLASGKRPLFNNGSLAERPDAQMAAARADAAISSGVAWVREMIDELWAVAEANDPIPDTLHARCRLACSHSVDGSIRAVESLVREAGSTGNVRSSPLAQLLLDARAVAGHFMVGPYQMSTAGRVLLGLDAGDRHF